MATPACPEQGKNSNRAILANEVFKGELPFA
jgi:hypothetical protein